ncbi:MAG: PQQ-binding-like beta-propeller repeat protein [Phycisphaerae bacterium]|nr:PQQ-binding-like beta-propeller repeat protein [Phycisphaerae bacterium]
MCFDTFRRPGWVAGLSTLGTALFSLAGSAARAESPYARDALTSAYEQASRTILSQPGVAKKGYCFVFGAGRGRLAYELARQSDLRIIGAVEDVAALAAARKALDEAGLYGDRIALQPSSLSKLRYRDYAAALVVSDSILAEGACRGSAAEMFRMVRPDGGIALIGQPAGCPKRLRRDELEGWLKAGGVAYTITESDPDGLWARIDRGPLPGSGEWTHMWADLGNTACSGDERTTDSFKVLWFGEPGPSIMIDRHWEPVSPLYKDGRFIVPGFDRIVCCDAYNGARLWDLSVPGAARIAMMRDAGWLALDDEYLYVATKGDCLKVGVKTGEVAESYRTPSGGLDWGYVAIDGDLLFGSEQRPQASYLASNIGSGAELKALGLSKLGAYAEGNQLGRGDDRFLITSKALFCRDRNTGKELWRYADESVIANPTICVGGGGVCFFESREPSVVADEDGRVKMPQFAKGASEHLVKLDKTTGKVLWRRQAEAPCRHVLHLSHARGVLVASGCTTIKGNYWYHLRAFRDEDGSPMWQRDVDSTFADKDKDHGKQDKHPVIVGDRVVLKQGSFRLEDGAPLGLAFQTSNCADCAASMKHIFTRNSGVARMISLNKGGAGVALCSAIRPGCYISIIPAGGVIMLPAFSAGCTCAYTIQTTIAWLPQ